MSAADDAYAEAERLIARAKRSRAKKLELSHLKTRALARLPPGIATLDKLLELDLRHTQVADLAPLAGLTGLTTLSLDNTQASDLAPLAGLTGLTQLGLDNSAALDLRPLLGLRALVEAPELYGLSFANSAAARADPRIAEIAAIKDNATRAQTLFDYLETWVPPLPPEAPEPDSFLPVVNGEGRANRRQLEFLIRTAPATRITADLLADQITALLRDIPCEPETNHLPAEFQVFEYLRDILRNLSRAAASDAGAPEADQFAAMSQLIAKLERQIAELTQRLERSEKGRQMLEGELAKATEELAKKGFVPKYKEELGAKSAELTVWLAKTGMIAGFVHLLGVNSTTLAQFLAAIEKLL